MRKNRPFVLFISVLFLLSVLFLFTAPALAAEEYSEYTDYREIPGVTQQEITAIEALKSDFGSFSYGMNYSTESFMHEDGSAGGFAGFFCEWLGQLFGTEFRSEIYEWDDLISGLEAGTIDFSGELTKTSEREMIYYMTNAIAERNIKYFRLRNSELLSDIAKERPLRYAFLDGATSHHLVAESSEETFEAYFVHSYAEAYTMLTQNEIDAFFDEGTAEAAFDIYENVTANTYFPLIYTPVSFTTANENLAPFISVVQKALDNGAMHQLSGLYNLGEEDYMQHKLLAQLTDEEEAYIEAHKQNNEPIEVLVEYDNYPVCFYNENEEEFQGIAIDILQNITSISGLEFSYANEQDDEWTELLHMLESGEASMISELLYSKEREGRFIWPDEPYTEDYYALLSQASYPDITLNQVSYSKVGLIKDSAYAEVFSEWFPDHTNTITYISNDAAFEALEKGEVELVMATQNSLLSITNYHENPGFKANLVFDRQTYSMFGFNVDETLLCSIIGKAQVLTDTDTITERWTRKVFDYRSKLAREQLPYLIGFSILLVAAFILVLTQFLKNRRLSKNLEKTVAERTAELVIQTEAAQVASRTKSEFLARMSHEIRTPLNAVMGMTQIARQSVGDSEKTLASIDEISAASSHLLGILNDVLDMSKIESGKFILAHEQFFLKDSMHEVENIIKQRCAEKNITFETDIAALPDVSVAGDKLRLKQVLINLLGNAVKFTPERGKIRFLVETLSETDENIKLKFIVADTGIGMNTQQVQKLFNAFEQADETIAVRFGGTGLGLAISQNLVQEMGGEISVKSAEGIGSTFSFSINLAKVAGKRVDVAKHQDTPLNLSGKHLLLAEDIEINRLILTELLADTGIEIDEAQNGKEALEKFEASPPGYYSLIFMDIQMPEMDGYTASEKIRALHREDAKAIPIVAMTANAYREDIEKALESGMTAHVAKPIDMDAVLDLLRKYIAS